MAVQKVSGFMLYGVAADTKPTTYPANTIFVEQDTGKFFRYTGSAWAALNAEYVGKAVASGNGSATAFNIAHGVGSTPTYVYVDCSSVVNTFTYALDSTNIVVTFTTAPASGTNNVVFYWRAIA